MSGADSRPEPAPLAGEPADPLAPFVAAFRAAPLGPATAGDYLDALGPAGEAHARRSVLAQLIADATRGGRTPAEVVAPLVGDLGAVLGDLGRAMGYRPPAGEGRR